MPPVEAIVLAAGASRRFGPENKLLQPYGTSTVVGCVVRALREAGLVVRVVVGHEADRVAEAVAPAESVFNPHWESGMGSSLACGVAACSPDSSVLVALGDMPDLQPDVVRTLLNHVGGNPWDIVAPVYAGESDRLGHPIILGYGHRAALLALSGDEGARKIIQASGHVVRVPVAGSLADRDEPA